MIDVENTTPNEMGELMRTLESINLEIAVAERKRDEIRTELILQEKYLRSLYSERISQTADFQVGERFFLQGNLIEITDLVPSNSGQCEHYYRRVFKNGNHGKRLNKLYSFEFSSLIKVQDNEVSNE